MPLVSVGKMLERARSVGYGVCYCEAWNLESLQAVVAAAEEVESPIITGFNGGFLIHAGRAQSEDLALYASMGLTALRRSNIPVALLLNETDNLAQIEEGIGLGFNAVMVENEHLPLDEYRQLVKYVVRIAQSRNVWVEAQVGTLPDGSGRSEAELTDPATARAFVEETGIDALGVAVGNTHILTTGKAPVDFDRLGKIHDKVKVPLVLHGGTGIPLELAQSCIRWGVVKVNFGTVLKQAYLAAIREKLVNYREPMNPHPFLGMGGRDDVLVAGREAVKRKVKELLEAFGSAWKAQQLFEPHCQAASRMGETLKNRGDRK
jgi:ketose-bisphosphate aldolase